MFLKIPTVQNHALKMKGMMGEMKLGQSTKTKWRKKKKKKNKVVKLLHSFTCSKWWMCKSCATQSPVPCKSPKYASECGWKESGNLRVLEMGGGKIIWNHYKSGTQDLGGVLIARGEPSRQQIRGPVGGLCAPCLTQGCQPALASPFPNHRDVVSVYLQWKPQRSFSLLK